MGLVKGKSDPYTVLRVGNKQFKTKTIKETLNPRWNEVYEVILSNPQSIGTKSFQMGNSDRINICFQQFVIHEAPGQELEVELYDEDTDADDFLGR